MKPYTTSGPGGIFVESQNEDDEYADFIAQQSDEEERPRQPAPEPSVVEKAFQDVINGQLDTGAVYAVMGRRVGTIEDYWRLKDLYDAAVRVLLHTGAR